MPCALAGKHQSRCAHDGGKVASGFFKLFVYNNIIKLGHVADFLAGGAQAPLDRLFGVLSPTAQPALELLEDRGRRNDEDAHRVGKGLPDLPRALPVDFEQDVQALRARFGDPLPGGSVAVSVDLGRFQKLAALEHRVEGLALDEVILAPVHLARARGPRGEGNREREPLVLGERGAHQRRFARARGRRDDEQVAGHCCFTMRGTLPSYSPKLEPLQIGLQRLVHSMFWICSRICSISSLNSRLASESSFDTDFEPSVFASRFSSCIRKSRRLPTAPPALTTRCTSSRCAPRRLSSSATSAVPPSTSRRRAASFSS